MKKSLLISRIAILLTVCLFASFFVKADPQASPVVIVSEPQNYMGEEGSRATFAVEAQGEGLSYQWQISSNGGVSWSNSSVQKSTYSAILSSSSNNRMVRCVVSDMHGNSVTSKAATMTIGDAVTPLSIITEPQNYSGEEGSRATFTVEARGDGVTYQWQISGNGGGSWSNSSVQKSTYSAVLSSSSNRRMVRCVVSDMYGNSITSRAASMTIELPVTELEIITQPQNYLGEEGSRVTFAVEARGDGLSYQWQISGNGGESWSNSSVKKSAYSTTLSRSSNNRMVRCIVSDMYGNSITSQEVCMTIEEPVTELEIITQPQNYLGEEGSRVTFAVEARGDGLSYQWQISGNGGESWSNSSVKKSAYSTTLSRSSNNRMVRCIVSDMYGNSITSQEVSMTIEEPVTELEIITQPQNYTGEEGSRAAFAVEAQGDGLSYQWQFSSNGGESWNNSSVKKNTYSTTLSRANNNRMVRCIVSDMYGNSITSQEVSMTIEEPATPLEIITDPQDCTGEEGSRATFTVEAQGDGLRYQWQISSDGQNWENCSSETDSFEIDLTEDLSGRMVRCVVTDIRNNSISSQNALITVNAVLRILTQPQDISMSVNNKFFFDVTVNRTGVTYRWEISSNGGGSWSTSSVTSRQYSSTATLAKNGWMYRCIVTDGNDNQVISEPAVLTVSSLFEIVRQPESVYGEWGESIVFSLEATGETLEYQWETSADGQSWSALTLTSAKTTRLNQIISPSTMGKYYRCVLTDGNGDALITEVVRIYPSAPGFSTYNGKTYYVYEDGTRPAGLTQIDGKTYYFNSQGVPSTGFVTVNGERYHFDEDGAASEGFVYNPESHFTFFSDASGKLQVGWMEYQSERYYFRENGLMARGLSTIDGDKYYFDFETGGQSYGLQKVGIEDLMYFDPDTGKAVSGKKVIDGRTYYFSEEEKSFGVALSGMFTLGGERYYCDPETRTVKEGFFTYRDETYYSDREGKCLTGLCQIGDGLYYFDQYSRMKTGLRQCDGYYYCFSEETGAAISGWYLSDAGAVYYFDPSTLQGKTGQAVIDGVTFYFTNKARLRTGVVKENNELFYYDPDDFNLSEWVETGSKSYYVGDNNALLTGLQRIDGHLYYFSPSSGEMLTGHHTVDGVSLFFEPYAITGFRTLQNENVYYFTETGVSGGVAVIDGQTYGFSDSGVMLFGRQHFDDGIYYFDPDTGQAISGWVTVKNSYGDYNRAYFDPEDLKSVIGLHEIDGDLYFFNENGWMQTGRVTTAEGTFFFDKVSGIAYRGFVVIGENTYCFDGENGLVSGPTILEIDGSYYYFNSSGALGTGPRQYNGVTYFFSREDATLQTGFVKDGSYVYYSDGLNGLLTGLQTIDGQQFYFSDAGVLKYGLQIIDNQRYFFDYETGIRTYGPQLNPDNNKVYMLTQNNATGTVVEYGGVKYLVSGSATLTYGYSSSAGMYFDPTSGEAQEGLITFNNSSGAELTYYFTSEGVIKSVKTIVNELNALKNTEGWGTVQGHSYYVENGEFLKGLQTISMADGSVKTYYFSSLSGAMLTGLRRIDGDAYYFGDDGALKTGQQIIDGEEYYFDPATGKMSTGFVQFGGSSRYYLSSGVCVKNSCVMIAGENISFDADGSAGSIPASGGSFPHPPANAWSWTEENGKRYYHDGQGAALSGEHIVERKLYFFDEDGVFIGERDGRYFTEEGMLVGFNTVDGSTYYFDPMTGVKVTGERKIGGDWYCFDETTGAMLTGWVDSRFYDETGKHHIGWLEHEGKQYWFDYNGHYITGLKAIADDSGEAAVYFFADNGEMETGRISYRDKLYYFEESGERIGVRKTGFVEIEGNLYYFWPEAGYAATGQQVINEKYYYFDPQTGVATYGLVQVGGSKYYFTAEGDGKLYGLTVFDNGDTFFFDESTGRMEKGYWKLDGVRYYFDYDTGKSTRGIFQTEPGVYYGFEAGGGTLSDLVIVDGKEYYCYPDSGQAAFGLVSIGSKLYYIDREMGLLRNTTVQVEGVSYSINGDGEVSVVGDDPVARLIRAGISRLGSPYYDKDESFEVAMEQGAYSCSLFVKTVFGEIGIEIPAVVPFQYYGITHDGHDYIEITDQNDLKPGDIIYTTVPHCSSDNCRFWSEMHHVMVYLGGGKVMEATSGYGSTRTGVVIQDYSVRPDYFVFAILRMSDLADD